MYRLYLCPATIKFPSVSEQKYLDFFCLARQSNFAALLLGEIQIPIASIQIGIQRCKINWKIQSMFFCFNMVTNNRTWILGRWDISCWVDGLQRLRYVLTSQWKITKFLLITFFEILTSQKKVSWFQLFVYIFHQKWKFQNLFDFKLRIAWLLNEKFYLFTFLYYYINLIYVVNPNLCRVWFKKNAKNVFLHSFLNTYDYAFLCLYRYSK